MDTKIATTPVELWFRVRSTHLLPSDHGYALYGALSRILPSVHRDNGIAIRPIHGYQVGGRRIRLTDRSSLVIRAAAEQIPKLIPLAGARIDLSGASIRIGVPQVRVLTPSSRLRSRLVVIKITGLSKPEAVTPERFAEAVQRQLEQIDIAVPPAAVEIGKRRTLRIHRREIVGYEVIIDRLDDAQSLRLQSHGLGGRHHMGCGIFVPFTLHKRAGS
ncbi:MAG: type I-MYXAN CRISPR-associated protein Cas6/Cmx6 [Pirellulaceae bacterium]|nr:MAG: type I-MYXAN CRISPR-associated protein Cas6/Cmx6 [Pirellulaceae bacterium]